MKRVLSSIIIIVQLILFSCSTAICSEPQSNYDLYYSQFVDTKEPLAEIQKKDFEINRSAAFLKYPPLSQIPDANRTDFFDISYGQDPMQKLDIHHLKGIQKGPVIFFIHGGGWSGGDKDYSRFVAPTWVALGYTVVSINYRLIPKSPYPAQIEDCAMALKWVTNNIHRYGGDPQKIAVVGHSAGSQLGALLVCNTKWQEKYCIDMKKIKCWVPMSSVFDFSMKENYYHPMTKDFCNAFLGTAPENVYDASPINFITGKEPPCLILHGGDDWLVPRINAIEMYKALVQKGSPAELEIVKGYWHSIILNNFNEKGFKPAEIVNSFLAKYLLSDVLKVSA